MLREEGIIEIDRRHGEKFRDRIVNGEVLGPEFDQKLSLLLSESYIKGASAEQINKRIQQFVNRIFGGEERA